MHSTTSITTRIGRSGPDVRINSDVVPQSRVRASKVEGRNVFVTGGEYRGLTGEIYFLLPRGPILFDAAQRLMNGHCLVLICFRNG